MTDTRQKIMVRIVYKSGYTHDFPVYKFEIQRGSYSWEAADVHNNPVLMGVDDIAAVWQIGVV